MRNRSTNQISRTVFALFVLAILVLSNLSFVPSSLAFPPRGEACTNPGCKASCPTGQALVRLENKHCPAIPRKRPAFNLQRACCRNHAGKVNCRQFPHCPERSPS